MDKPKWFIMMRYFWPAYLWGIIVLFLTGLPGNDLPTLPSYWDSIQPDKIVHMGMFGLLFLLLAAGSYYKGGKTAISKKLIIIYLSVTIALGGIIELLQKWVFIGRSCDIQDFFADTVGIMLALLFYLVIFENKKQKIN
jgi:VanZ family protein